MFVPSAWEETGSGGDKVNWIERLPDGFQKMEIGSHGISAIPDKMDDFPVRWLGKEMSFKEGGGEIAFVGIVVMNIRNEILYQ